MNAPCKGCEERAIGCHTDKCPKWKAYSAEHNRVLKAKAKEQGIRQAFIAMRDESFKRAKKGKR